MKIFEFKLYFTMNLSKSLSSLTSWSSSLSSWSYEQQQQQQQQQQFAQQQLIQQQQQSFSNNNNIQQFLLDQTQLELQQLQIQPQTTYQQLYLPFQFKRPITGVQNQQIKNKPIPNNFNSFLAGSLITPVAKYSRKVFIGGLPPDIDESKNKIFEVKVFSDIKILFLN